MVTSPVPSCRPELYCSRFGDDILEPWRWLFQSQEDWNSSAQFLISNAVAIQSSPLSSVLSVLIWGKWSNLFPPSYPLLNPHLKLDSGKYKSFPNGKKGFLFSCCILLLPAMLCFNPCSQCTFPGKHVGKSISPCSTWHRGTEPLNSFSSMWVGPAYLQNEPAPCVQPWRSDLALSRVERVKFPPLWQEFEWNDSLGPGGSRTARTPLAAGQLGNPMADTALGPWSQEKFQLWPCRDRSRNLLL